jgi:hypothetical protein
MCGSRQSAPAPQIMYVPYIPPAPAVKDPWAGGPPNSGNEIQGVLRTPNNGLATIESVAPSAASATNAPSLADPAGESSQRVQRQKAKLAIAQ